MSSSDPLSTSNRESKNFIQQIIDNDLASGRVSGDIVTRFPPEPNGYPHIGHAKAICLNFGISAQYGGPCHLRFDDTNPETEDMEYVHAMKRDIRWLGFDWGEHEYYASDYFEQLFELAMRLIKNGKAYVDSQSGDDIRKSRGTVTEPGVNSPFRNRTPQENADLFQRMRDGEFDDGTHVLRAMIDMASSNMLLRDPVLYRIKKASHYRRGNEWPIYPLYDFAHPLSDAIEGITHSLCTLEFDVHRPLYDWLLDALYDEPRPHQYESARLNLDYTIMSKRKLLTLVNEGHVEGWDDPRMPTISGLRRRGFTGKSIRRFCDLIGVAKADNRVDYALLEYAIRDDLNATARRVMCVLDPLKIVLTNMTEGETELLSASYWPHDIPREGRRDVALTREIFVERSDFMETPRDRFHRLSPGNEVRLRYAYIIRCNEVIKDENGDVIRLHCTLDRDTRSGGASSRSVKGTVHWVSASEGLDVEVRLYDRLFSVPNPEDVGEGESFLKHLNPDSVKTVRAVIEPSTESDKPGTRYQFERQGFFYLDPVDFEKGKRVWNRTTTLRNTWGKSTTASDAKPGASKRTKPAAVRAERDPLQGLDEASIARARSLVVRYCLSLEDAAILAVSSALSAFYEEAASRKSAPSAVANWLINELRPLLPGGGIGSTALSAEGFERLVELHASGILSSGMAREVLSDMVLSGEAPDVIVEKRGLKQISDEDHLAHIVQTVLAAHPDRVEAYRNGKKGLIGFFMGQVMQRTGGAANPQTVRSILENELG